MDCLPRRSDDRWQLPPAATRGGYEDERCEYGVVIASPSPPPWARTAGSGTTFW